VLAWVQKPIRLLAGVKDVLKKTSQNPVKGFSASRRISSKEGAKL